MTDGAGPGPGLAMEQPFPAVAGHHDLPSGWLCWGEGHRLSALVLVPPDQFPEFIPEEHA